MPNAAQVDIRLGIVQLVESIDDFRRRSTTLVQFGGVDPEAIERGHEVRDQPGKAQFAREFGRFRYHQVRAVSEERMQLLWLMSSGESARRNRAIAFSAASIGSVLLTRPPAAEEATTGENSLARAAISARKLRAGGDSRMAATDSDPNTIPQMTRQTAAP